MLSKEDIKAIAEEVIKLQKADEGFFDSYVREVRDYIRNIALEMMEGSIMNMGVNEKTALKQYELILKKKLRTDINGIATAIVEAAEEFNESV